MNRIKSIVTRFWWVFAILGAVFLYNLYMRMRDNSGAGAVPATNSPLPDPAEDPLLAVAFRR